MAHHSAERRCRTCGSPYSVSPANLISRHSTSDGSVGYARCPHGHVDLVLGADERHARHATVDGAPSTSHCSRANAAGREVRARQASLHVRRRGAGEPLVLVHGVGSSGSSWEPALDRLTAHHDVLVVDLPGHGQSPPMPTNQPYTVEGYVEAVLTAMADARFETPHVAGNSLGGAVALELAFRGRVSSATAISPIGFWRGLERTYCMASLRAMRRLGSLTPETFAQLTRFRPLRRVLLAQFMAHPQLLTPNQAEAAVRDFTTSPALLATLPHTKHYVLDRTTNVEVPVTVAWGTRDFLLPPWQQRRAARLLPHATQVALSACGHVPMADDPAAVASAILATTRAAGRFAR